MWPDHVLVRNLIFDIYHIDYVHQEQNRVSYFLKCGWSTSKVLRVLKVGVDSVTAAAASIFFGELVSKMEKRLLCVPASHTLDDRTAAASVVSHHRVFARATWLVFCCNVLRVFLQCGSSVSLQSRLK